MPFLASDVMTGARTYLNDNAASLYTNTVMVPYVIRANEALETELLSLGVEVQRQVTSNPIAVAAGALTLLLPNDFLLPIALYERASGSSAGYTLIEERMWNPTDYVPVNTLNIWAFYNNAVNFPGATTAREVIMQYDRQIAIISGENSPEEVYIAKDFLCAKTAELCARYIGMNKTFADDIAMNETGPAKTKLELILVGNMQGTPQRRIRFTTQRRTVGVK